MPSHAFFFHDFLEKGKQCKLKASRREIIKVTMKSMKLKRKPIKKTNKNVSWFSSKRTIKSINLYLARLTKN